MRKLATVWEGEVMGMRGGLQSAPEDRKVLILCDSQAAIAAVRKAGRTGWGVEGSGRGGAEEAGKSGA